MKKIIILFIGFIISFAAGFASAKGPLKIFIENKEVENNSGQYIIKDKNVYVSQDALKRDFGFNIFYDENKNKVSIYNINKNLLKEKNKLLQEFVEYYEAKTPDEAAEIWANGIKERNGVFQYAVLNNALKENLKESFEKQGSWATGVSNPWVENYEIKKQKMNASNWRYNIVFKAVTSTPETFTWHANLLISKEDNTWRIIHIQKDF